MQGPPDRQWWTLSLFLRPIFARAELRRAPGGLGSARLYSLYKFANWICLNLLRTLSWTCPSHLRYRKSHLLQNRDSPGTWLDTWHRLCWTLDILKTLLTLLRNIVWLEIGLWETVRVRSATRIRKTWKNGKGRHLSTQNVKMSKLKVCKYNKNRGNGHRNQTVDL